MLKTLWCLLAPLGVLVTLAAAGQAADTSYATVADIFQTRCVMCHSGPHAPLGLRLDSLDSLLAGSSNGPVVKAGQPTESELVRRVRGVSQPRMPLTGPPFLDDAQIALIETWVAAGLPAETGAPVKAATAPAAGLAGIGTAVNYADISPILLSRCVKCHTDNGLMGPAPESYLLTSYQATLSPVDRVRVVPAYPAASELVRRLNGQSLPRMPYDGPPYLEDVEVALIAEWIAQGALNQDNLPAAYPLGAKIRLQGTLVGQWQLEGGVPLHVTAATRFDKSPQAGNYVEVRGRLAGEGSIAVERLRRRDR